MKPSPLPLFAIATCLVLAGCNVSHNRHGHGDNVQVRTPFGDMHIKTNQDANIGAIGLSLYPGSVPVKEHDNKDDDAADINLNFGDFHLGVKAASYQTTDSPDKVEAFYRKDMARYGVVLKCKGGDTIGQPGRTGEGLTCSENDRHGAHTVHVNSDSDHVELRAGSPQHEHIVGVEPNDGGTKIGLVALDLPGHHDSSDSE
jgi:hypothetical protein